MILSIAVKRREYLEIAKELSISPEDAGRAQEIRIKKRGKNKT